MLVFYTYDVILSIKQGIFRLNLEKNLKILVSFPSFNLSM